MSTLRSLVSHKAVSSLGKTVKSGVHLILRCLVICQDLLSLSKGIGKRLPRIGGVGIGVETLYLVVLGLKL